MFHWDTNQLIFELQQIPNVKSVKSTDPGGDYDTCNLVIAVEGSQDRLYIAGYASTEDHMEDPLHADVRWVEISDGQDSSGGLNSTNKNLGLVYVEIRQYFLDRGAEVIEHHDEIF